MEAAALSVKGTNEGLGLLPLVKALWPQLNELVPIPCAHVCFSVP